MGAHCAPAIHGSGCILKVYRAALKRYRASLCLAEEGDIGRPRYY